jgi:predicted RNase H-like HicB family nuclease
MRLEGRVRKDGKWWLAEIPALDYVTQGKSKKEAFEMAKDIVETGVDKKGFKVEVIPGEADTFTLIPNDTDPLLAHMLRRMRQKEGLSVREASKRLGSSSPNAYGIYEQGKASPTIGKLEKLLRAVAGSRTLVLKLT